MVFFDDLQTNITMSCNCDYQCSDSPTCQSCDNKC